MNAVVSVAIFALAWFVGLAIRKAAYNPTHRHDTRPKRQQQPGSTRQLERQLRRDERQLKRNTKKYKAIQDNTTNDTTGRNI